MMSSVTSFPYRNEDTDQKGDGTVKRLQLKILVILQLTLLIPYFQISASPAFLGIVVGSVFLFIATRFISGKPRTFLASLFAIGAAGGLLVGYGWQDISAISLFFLVVGLAKLVEINSYRDTLFQVILLVVQTVFVLLLSPVFTTFVISILQMIGIVLMTQHGRQFSLAGLTKAFGILASAIPLALVFFLFFPRFNANLFDLGMMMGLPGAFQLSQGEPLPLNDSVGFDDIAAKSQSDTRVLIANFHEGVDPFFNGVPPLHELYWRGPVLWQYENNKWLPREGWNKRANRMRGKLSEDDIYEMVALKGKLTAYSVALFPSNSYWTYALNIPTRSAASTYVTKDFQLLNLNPIRNVLKYHMSSYLGYEMTFDLASEDRELALRVDADQDPRLQAYFGKMRREFPDDRAFINKVLGHFHEGYAYNPGQKSSGEKHAMDSFLFDKKIGNSAHYASAFAMIMRHSGIPTRLVAGYRGGNVVGLTEMVLILENSAYVWAESWLEGRGWVRIDPAMPVAGPPGTSTGGGGWGLAGNAGGAKPADDPNKTKDEKKEKKPTDQAGGNASASQADQTQGQRDAEEVSWMETFQSDWVSWLNGFNADVQKDNFLQSTEKDGQSGWLDLLKLLGGGAFLILLSAGVVLFFYNRLGQIARVRDPLRLEFDRFLKAIGKKDIILAEIENIGQLTEQIKNDLQNDPARFRELALEFIETYARLRYGPEEAGEKTGSVKDLAKIRKAMESVK